MEYVKNDIYLEKAYPLNSKMFDYYNKLKEINEMQNSLYYIKLFENTKPIYLPNFYKYNNRFDLDPSIKKIDISKIYRKDGTPHKWDIYVFKKKKGSGKKELSIKELENILLSGINFYNQYILIDHKDSKTKE